MACQFRRRYEDLEWYGVQTDTSKDRSLVHHTSRVSKTQLVSPMKPSIRGDETVTSQATEEATAQSRQFSKEQGTRNKERWDWRQTPAKLYENSVKGIIIAIEQFLFAATVAQKYLYTENWMTIRFHE
jgi:hypothetical protein